MIEVLRKTLNALFEHDSTNVSRRGLGWQLACVTHLSASVSPTQLRSASLIHVYLLVMLSGLLIGNKRTYELAEASRGTLINVSRKMHPRDESIRLIHFTMLALPKSRSSRRHPTFGDRSKI